MQHSFAPHGALLSSSFSPHLHYSILPPLPHRTLRSHSASTLTPAHPPHASNLRSQSASAKNEAAGASRGSVTRSGEYHIIWRLQTYPGFTHQLGIGRNLTHFRDISFSTSQL
ncbi:hypothetical protein TcWFU_008786 [Taenia crassiceps]|uniref:Uncharacterized protein n=1 Tax=Taenia crassiceps TaxID=6207 RepID=A0ABR4Q0S6_9CEST